MKKSILKIFYVVLKLSKLSIAKFIITIENILKKMTGNVHFPEPEPSLKSVEESLDALRKSATEAEGGSKAARDMVIQQRREVMMKMKVLRTYVEYTSNACPEKAEEMINSTGMEIRKNTPPAKRTFLVKNTDESGTVFLTCPKEKGDLMFNFSYSLTPHIESSFVEIGFLPRVKRTVTKLVPGKEYAFRYMKVTKNGESIWSKCIKLFVR